MSSTTSRALVAPSRHARPPVRMLLGVWLAAAALRLVHNEVMLADPLYFNPLGGNLPYLLAAEAISGGDLVPFDGPLSLNSPLYPYFLAGLYQLLGENAFYGIRVVTGLMDAGTCAMVSLLAWRHFGAIAGWAAGLVTAVYGPLVFFAADLNPVPLTLFLLTAALVVVDRARRPRGFLAAGLVFGLTAATRPNVLLAGLAALTVPWLRRSPAPSRAALALAAGLAMGVAPVTLVNVAASGELVLLTTSAGHNFYIGHNPQAEAQYVLPSGFDGDIFASMKVLAEEVEGRPFEDREVSSWYFRRGLAHVAENPGRELALLGRRSLLLVNDFEATTYASFDYQRHYSGVLRWTPSFLLLFALAIPGMSIAMRRERLHLWIPLATAAATVLLFFYIARLRVVMVPSLGVFAGAGVAILTAAVRDGRWRRLLSLTGAALVGAGVAALPILQSDTSNEWAKAGGVLRVAGNLDGAEAAFVKGVAENPDNANIWLSLASLYRAEGRTAAADSAQARADALLEAGDRDADTYRRALEAAP